MSKRKQSISRTQGLVQLHFSQRDKHTISSRPFLHWVIIVIVFLVVLWFSYYPVLSCQAQYFDDQQYYVNNPLVQNPSWKSIATFLTEVTHPSSVSGYYQPLSMISLMLDFFFGAQPYDLTVFHRTNLVLHITNVLLLMLFLYQLSNNFCISAGMSLLFGLHPIMVESIAWVSDRKTLLSTFFALISLIIYLRYTRNSALLLLSMSFLMYGMAIMSKPTLLILPMVLLVLDWGFLDRLNRKAVFEKIPFFIFGLVMLIVTYVSQYNSAGYYIQERIEFWKYPLMICYTVLFYLYKTFLPIGLPQYYPYPTEMLSTLMFHLIYTLFGAIIVLILCCTLRWSKKMFAGILFYILSILPTVQFVRYTHMGFSDKYLYFPMIGVVLTLCVIFCWVSRQQKRTKIKIVLMLFLFLVLITQATLVRKSLKCWESTITLYECLLHKTPGQDILHGSLGLEYQRLNKFKVAEEHYRKALEFKPNSIMTLNNYAMSLKSQGRHIEAEECLIKALSFKQDDAITLCNLGMLYELQSLLVAAKDCYKKAIDLMPDLTVARLNYANLLALEGNYSDAMGQYHYFSGKAKPPEYFLGLGILYFRQKDYSNAESFLREAVSIMPSMAQAYYYLGRLYQEQRNNHRATQKILKAVELDPSMRDAWVFLGDLYLSRGDTVNAAVCYQNALSIQRNDTGLLCRLAILYATSNHEFFGNKHKSVEYATKACELTSYENPGILDILSIAYASCGCYDTAVKFSEKAIGIAKKAEQFDLVHKIQTRLGNYKAVLLKDECHED